MRRFDYLLKRLQNLEPKPEILSQWPPEEGSFAWCLYEKLGRPVERMHSMDMYLAVAEKVWNEID
jgi:hypothetical protein